MTHPRACMASPPPCPLLTVPLGPARRGGFGRRRGQAPEPSALTCPPARSPASKTSPPSPFLSFFLPAHPRRLQPGGSVWLPSRRLTALCPSVHPPRSSLPVPSRQAGGGQRCSSSLLLFPALSLSLSATSTGAPAPTAPPAPALLLRLHLRPGFNLILPPQPARALRSSLGAIPPGREGVREGGRPLLPVPLRVPPSPSPPGPPRSASPSRVRLACRWASRGSVCTAGDPPGLPCPCRHLPVSTCVVAACPPASITGARHRPAPNQEPPARSPPDPAATARGVRGATGAAVLATGHRWQKERGGVGAGHRAHAAARSTHGWLVGCWWGPGSHGATPGIAGGSVAIGVGHGQRGIGVPRVPQHQLAPGAARRRNRLPALARTPLCGEAGGLRWVARSCRWHGPGRPFSAGSLHGGLAQPRRGIHREKGSGGAPCCLALGSRPLSSKVLPLFPQGAGQWQGGERSAHARAATAR